jgi:two-component system NtrC family sensor kinase
LDLSRQTQTYSEQVDLNTVIQDALRVLHNQYKHHKLNIIENYDAQLPKIQGNFANLGQVAINIIKNAIQAVAEQNGQIFLTTRFDQTIDQIVFECHDTGPGIPMEARHDIFKPFFTTKPVGQGTGLGLYISHEIIARHNGKLSIIDPDSPGTHFAIHLPVTG